MVIEVFPPSPWPGRIRAGLPYALFGGWALGEITRDCCHPLALLFYLPSPVIAACLWGWVGWNLRAKQIRRAGLLFALSLAPLLMILFIENQWTRPVATNLAQPENAGKRPFTLLHWNANYLYRGDEGMGTVLGREHPDAVVLSEVTHKHRLDALFRGMGREYTELRLWSITYLCRGEIDLLYEEKQGKAWAHLVRFTTDSQTATVLAIDLPSSIWIARAPMIRWVKHLILSFKPDVVVGDFNAPRRSRELAQLPAGYQHAYDQAGSGWSYSWPWPMPALAIDQAITHADHPALEYRLVSSWRSDHRLQVLRFLADPPANPTAQD